MSDYIGKLAMNQQGWTKYVQSADKVLRQQVNETLVAQHGAFAPSLTLAALEAECVWEQELLEARRAHHYEAELAYASEQSDDPAARDEEDEAIAALRVELIDNRSFFLGSFGDEATQLAGFVGETPAGGELLVMYAELITSQLRETPTRTNRFGMAVDLSVFITRQEGAIARVKAARDAVLREGRELQLAKHLRDEAQAALRAVYVLVAMRMEARFRLAGLGELADSLRPTTRRTASVEKPPSPLAA